MPTRAYKLEMVGPLHVGRSGIGFEETLDYFPSDSLFAALVVTWLEMRRIGPKIVTALPNCFVSPPALCLTSAFPYAGDLLFLPKPHLPVAAPHDQDGSSKNYKKARWVSPGIFQALTSSITATELQTLWDGSCTLQGNAVWMTKEELDPLVPNLPTNNAGRPLIWSRADTPHVAIDRFSSASNLYYIGQIHYAPGCGLWCMADGDKKWLRRLEQALQRMADSGIGGRRFRGGGHFHLHKDVSPPTFGAASGYQVLLSRLAPTVEQMDLLKAEDSRYDLVTVGGYSDYPGQTPVIRKRVRLLTEGSVIEASDTPPGQLVNVQPDGTWAEDGRKLPPPVSHPIYRYGYGFGVPINLPKDWNDKPSGGVE